MQNNTIEYLKSDNTRIPTAFAVFDGMGGESCGEIASYLAANAFNDKINTQFSYPQDEEVFLNDVCKAMNDAVCIYTAGNGIGRMGSTVAVLYLSQDKVNILNIGDSRVYKYAKGKLEQRSRDHVLRPTNKSKTALMQFLGIDEADMIIMPFITQAAFESGDRYLLCSDGLTDMLYDDEISSVLSENKQASLCAERLMQLALNKGGIDNITIILCDIHSN
jgi:protein phosphatase